MKESVFTLTMARNRWHPTETITDTDYADDLALCENTPTQADSLLHGLKQAVGGIGFFVNSVKIKLVCFNWDSAISSLNGKLLKLLDQFTYFYSNI